MIKHFVIITLVVLVSQMVIADEKRASTAINSAKILVKNKDFEGARALLAQVVDQDPEHAEAIYLIALSDEHGGDLKAALAGYKRCLELVAEDPARDGGMLKRDCQKAVQRLDEGKKILVKYAELMVKEAEKLKGRNDVAYETVMAAVEYLTGEEIEISSRSALQAKRHPRDAAAFGGHWYKVFEGKISWQAAKAQCESMGGYLACIEERDENEFLKKLANGRSLWIGATDEMQEGKWTWINGSPWRFADWDSRGEPNNADGVEDWAHIESRRAISKCCGRPRQLKRRFVLRRRTRCRRSGLEVSRCRSTSSSAIRLCGPA